ncbi:MAG: 1-deoxy-D-xylulose-5-phosphate reductoisomerase, partial [Gammaproteobacteria bacterium]
TVLSGIEGLERVAAHNNTDYVMAAIVGAAGLRPTLSAARAGKRVLLANKEALVMSGQIFIDEVKNYGAQLLPIDSEHNAIFQCMPPGFETGLQKVGVKRILLTASGGPFRDMQLHQLRDVTPEQACAHPNWVMGKKISVDSATMMNKGLEVIEACWLFGTTTDFIQVVLHPQSVIHSMVEYNDGSVLAQLGNPDMRTPIAHALAWPERFESGVESLNLFDVARLDFQVPDFQRFPCLRLAIDAMRNGGTSSTILNLTLY